MCIAGHCLRFSFKVSRAKTEHLQATEDTDPVRMKRYMETETVNLPTVHSFKYVGSTIDRREKARPTMLYGCKTWPMSVKDGNNKDENGAMCND